MQRPSSAQCTLARLPRSRAGAAGHGLALEQGDSPVPSHLPPLVLLEGSPLLSAAGRPALGRAAPQSHPGETQPSPGLTARSICGSKPARALRAFRVFYSSPPAPPPTSVPAFLADAFPQFLFPKLFLPPCPQQRLWLWPEDALNPGDSPFNPAGSTKGQGSIGFS